MLDRIATFPARHPLVVLLLVLALTAFTSVYVGRLHIDSSMDTIFLDDDPERGTYEEFKKTFGEDEVIVVSLKVPKGDVFNPATLQKLQRITQAIERFPKELGVDRVVSLTNVDDVWGSDDGFTTAPLISGIPDDPVELGKIKARALANPLYRRNLVGESAQAAAINVFLAYRPGDREYKENLLNAIRKVVEPERGPEELHYAGIPVLTVYTSEYLRRDMLIFVPLSILVMAVVLALTFRSLAGVLLPLVTVGIATTWTMGFVSLMGRSVSIISSIIPSLLLTLGCAFTVHVLSRYYTEKGATAKERLLNTSRHVAFPVLLSGITTVIGFGSMITNDVTQIFEFGLYSAFGIFVTMLLAGFFVPAALHYLHPKPKGVVAEETSKSALTQWVHRLARLSMDYPKAMVAGWALVLAIAVWGSLRIEVDTDYAANFKADSEPVRALLFMRENLSGERPINVVLTPVSGEEGSALEPSVLAKVDAVERLLRKHELVATTLSIGGYLKRMNQAMNGDDPAAHVLPSTRRLAAQYLDLYGRPSEIRRFLSDDRRSVVVVGRSSIISSKEFLEFMGTVRSEAAKIADSDVKVTVTGSMYLLSKSSVEISWGQAKSLALSSISILFSALFLFRFRSIKFGLIAFIPNAVPILLNFGTMGFVGVALTTGTSIIAGMALGIIDDDTIHFLTSYREARESLHAADSVHFTHARVARPTVFAAVINAIAFLVLCFSSFAPLVALGWLTALTMMTALFADLMLLPALLMLFDQGGPLKGRTLEESHG